jgi:hypothetical protein
MPVARFEEGLIGDAMELFRVAYTEHAARRIPLNSCLISLSFPFCSSRLLFSVVSELCFFFSSSGRG